MASKKGKKQKVKRKFSLHLPSKLRKKRYAIAVAVVFLIVSSFIWLFWGIPLPSQLSDAPDVSTKLYDRNGKIIYEIFTETRRSPVELAEIPQHVIDATIAIEDSEFYLHSGFSIRGMARAFYKTVFKQKLEGGSTLTQQLIKNSLLTPERTVRRKIREFALAMLVELRYSKEEILELYFNQIPYGSTAYGVEAASELYFNKRVSELNLAEASLLAGLPAAPTRYSPFGAHPELAKGRQATVLSRMVEENYISQEEAEEAKNAEIHYAEGKELKAPHFALWVKDQLAEKYGDAVVERGGLRVTTTLDLDLQESAQEIVREEVDSLARFDVGNGAAIVTRPKTGEILTMVGSKDYFADDEDGKFNVIFAQRQPGSSIKPLNYALAIKDKKITGSTVLADVPTCFSVVGQEQYCPSNYDGEFHGATQTRFALGNSYNIPAVRVLALNGVAHFMNFARELGITTFTNPDNYGLSLTLGGGEVLPFDMATAYGSLANQGVKQPLISVLKVEDWQGKVLEETKLEDLEGDRVLTPDVTFIISHMLLDNNARVQAFGERSFLNVSGHPEVSVKTGTTNDRRDNWTIGYTKDAVVIAWVGNNDNSPMSGAVSGVSGASPIWNKIMKEVLDKAEEGAYNKDDKGHSWPQQPADVVGANICSNTGYLPNADSADCPQRFEYFLRGTIPDGGAFRQDVPVPPDNTQTENHLVVNDPLGTLICLTCPFPMQPTSVRYPL